MRAEKPNWGIEARFSLFRKISRALRKLLPSGLLQCEVVTKLYKCLKDVDNKIFVHRMLRREDQSVRRLRKKEIISVAFLVSYDSAFPGEMLLREMVADSRFDPKIFVVPDPSRGVDNQEFQYNKALRFFTSKFGDICNVKGVIDKTNHIVLDLHREMDMVCPCYPYPTMAHRCYTTEYLLERGVVPIFVWYGINVTNLDIYMGFVSINLFWKIFVETPLQLVEYKNRTLIRGKNAVLTGYFKFDSFANVKERNRSRKKVILAPHHTVDLSHGVRSSFLRLYDFLIDLPRMFPEIDWVFRPHQLLYVVLSRDDMWGPERTDAYYREWDYIKNVEVQMGGDYIDTFINSDGIIHDCESFLVEYLVTGHPACYLNQPDVDYDRCLSPLAANCRNVCYNATSRDQILEYVKNVVLCGNDSLKEARLRFVDSELKINYPHAARCALCEIKKGLEVVR